jgi:hypothetical protein
MVHIDNCGVSCYITVSISREKVTYESASCFSLATRMVPRVIPVLNQDGFYFTNL